MSECLIERPFAVGTGAGQENDDLFALVSQEGQPCKLLNEVADLLIDKGGREEVVPDLLLMRINR